LSLATFWDLKIVCSLFTQSLMMRLVFVWCDKAMDLSTTAFQTLSSRSLSSLQEEKIFLSISSVCLKTSFSSSLAGSAFAGFLIVFFIRPAGSFLSAAVERSRGSCNESDLVIRNGLIKGERLQGIIQSEH
jgi:hypothetical protein